MSYQKATDKPERLLTGYGSVRGAELKEIYSSIDDDTPKSQIENLYGFLNPETGRRDTDHIDNCLRFLETLDMIEMSAQDVLNRINTDVYPEMSFEPRLLYHINRQEGEQRHLADVHSVLMDINAGGEPGTREVNTETLLEEVKRELDYEVSWNPTKIRMWANLMDNIGAVSYSTSADQNLVITSPSRALIHELLSWYHSEHVDGGGTANLVDALEWVDEEFVEVFSERIGNPTVHKGVVDVIESMCDDGVLEITATSDRTESVELDRDVAGFKNPIEYSISEKPDSPEYRYPLEKDERGIL